MLNNNFTVYDTGLMAVPPPSYLSATTDGKQGNELQW